MEIWTYDRPKRIRKIVILRQPSNTTVSVKLDRTNVLTIEVFET